MILNVTHGQTTASAGALIEHSTGLSNSIKRMKETLAPLYKNWYQSGSPTGDKVHKHEVLIDTAMSEITRQMSGSGQVLADFTASLQRTEGALSA
jgi:hypothetical protein